jgi:pimeloyl-ACP methyl ester carboxylesterase
VASLILSHTRAPNPRRVWQSEWGIRLLAVLPLPAIRSAMILATYGFLPRRTPEHAFWRRHFRAVLDTQTKEACINRFRVARDFDRLAPSINPGTRGWAGRVLILEAESDRLVSAAEQATLRARYPLAQIYTFRGGAHTDTIDQPAEQIAVIGRFLKGGDEERHPCPR